MSIDPNKITIGSVFKRNGRVLKVIDKHHVKLSKGGACQQVKCMDVQDKSIMEMRLNVNETLEEVYISKKVLEFSYSSDQVINFVDDEYHGVELNERDLGMLFALFSVDLPAEQMPRIEIEYFTGENENVNIIVNVKLLEDVILTVLQTADSIKGETAKSADKPAVLEGGIKTKVPSHVNIGDKVVLNKMDLSYVSKK
jgi:elongation factor P